MLKSMEVGIMLHCASLCHFHMTWIMFALVAGGIPLEASCFNVPASSFAVHPGSSGTSVLGHSRCGEMEDLRKFCGNEGNTKGKERFPLTWLSVVVGDIAEVHVPLVLIFFLNLGMLVLSQAVIRWSQMLESSHSVSPKERTQL